MSLSNNFPTSKPSLNLDFANVGALDPRITFTRATSATFVNQLGVIQTAASGIPRFDYDPSTLAARGLLIEEQRTNLVTYSEQFDNAAWTTKQNCTITANAGTAPDGTQNADLMLVTNTSAPLFFRAVALSSSTYSTTVYAKATSSTINNKINIGTLDGSNNAATFDLTTGTVSSVYSGHAASMALQNNGWYRCQVNHPTFSGTAYPLIAVNSPTVDAAIGPLLWGYQLEAGSFATSYIPTVASTVTRNTDLASVNTLSPWYSSECTIYCEASVLPGNVNSSTKMLFGGGPTGNSPALIEYGGVLQLLIQGVGFPLAAATGLTVATKKVAGRFKNGSFGLAVDGVVTSSTNAQTAGSGSAFGIGSVPIPSDYLNGHVRRVAFYPRALTNAELQALTA